MVILGIDDAGRGPVIGPMFVAGVLLSDKQESKLMKEGVTDSKLIEHKHRVRLAKFIKANSMANFIIEIKAKEIDASILSGTNLNTLEAKHMAAVINKISGKYEDFDTIIDCPSVNIISWKKTLIKFISNSRAQIKCEHKADYNHISVAAASVLAKVWREDAMAELKQQYNNFGDLGSGYPSDSITKAFLKKNGEVLRDSGIFRTTWVTWKRIFPDKDQKTLTEF